MRAQIPQLAPRSDALVEFLQRVLGGLALAGELPRSGLLNDNQNPPKLFIHLVVRPRSADHSAGWLIAMGVSNSEDWNFTRQPLPPPIAPKLGSTCRVAAKRD